MKKAVLFDFHNTLATCDGWLELEIKTLPTHALKMMAGRKGFPEYSAQLGETAEHLFRQLRETVRQSGVEISAVEGLRRVLGQMGIAPPDEAIVQVVKELELGYLPRVEMTPGADTTIKRLHDEGYKLGVVSSAGYHPFIECALHKIGVRPYFSVVLTSVGEEVYKSDPEIYRRAVSRLGVDPREAVHVGDHVKYDVEVPKKAGLATVWFAAHARRSAQLYGQQWEQVAEAGRMADAVVEAMEELPETIGHL